MQHHVNPVAQIRGNMPRTEFCRLHNIAYMTMFAAEHGLPQRLSRQSADAFGRIVGKTGKAFAREYEDWKESIAQHANTNAHGESLAATTLGATADAL